MAGSRPPRRPSGLDIGRLTEELHAERPAPSKDMRRWKSRLGRAKRRAQCG